MEIVSSVDGDWSESFIINNGCITDKEAVRLAQASGIRKWTVRLSGREVVRLVSKPAELRVFFGKYLQRKV